MAQPVQFQNQDSFQIEEDEITKADSDSDSNTEVAIPNPSFWQSAIFIKNDQLMLHRIEDGTSEYVNVKRSFVRGKKNLEKHIDVVGIHRKNYEWSGVDEARLEVFRVFAAAVASRNGGDANIKYGWYGGSREEIREILCYGFRSFENRSISNGRGVYFSPANNAIASARMSIADKDGVMHILLCRLILGKSELIAFGSKIDLPTSTEFDSGVDNISSPTKYIIWEPYMNTLVLPLFIVSFKASVPPSGAEALRIQHSHYSKIVKTHLPEYVSSSKMALIKKLHAAFTQKKISSDTYSRNFRLIAGNNVLRDIIQRYGRTVNNG